MPTLNDPLRVRKLRPGVSPQPPRKELPVVRQKIGQDRDPRPDDRILATLNPPVGVIQDFIHSIRVDVIVGVAIIFRVILQEIVRNSFEIGVIADRTLDSFVSSVVISAFPVPHLDEQTACRFHLGRTDRYGHAKEFFLQFDQLSTNRHFATRSVDVRIRS